MRNDGFSEEADKAASSHRYYKMGNNFVSPAAEIGGGFLFGEGASGILSGSNSSGGLLFTETQWQELERQMMIYKYIMASIPVPPHLLITTLSTQSIKGGMDLRFSNGSDPEPWRCRRTDGKKWRCSRDVAPDQKYCERHAHKNRPRSRKHVEIQSHNTNVVTTSTTTSSGLNVVNPASSYQHPRSTEWLLKNGGTTIPPVSPSNQQFDDQQSMSLYSPRVGSKRTHIFPNTFEQIHQHDSHLNYCNLQLDSAGARRQHFIDAWSKTGGVDDCSLTLSMQCSGGGMDGVDHSFESGDVLKSHNQWLDQGSWMGSPPGGPLGEALGVGMATKAPLNAPSTHGHSSSTTTSSSFDKGGNTGQEFSFIR